MAETTVPPRTATGSCRGRRPRRWGRWVYSDRNGQYGCAGWLLDGSPLVVDFMPGMTDCEPGRGLYVLYNWPVGRCERIVSRWCRLAMDEVEETWDEYRRLPCARCGRRWDGHQVEGTGQQRAVWAWLTGCAGYVFPQARCRTGPAPRVDGQWLTPLFGGSAPPGRRGRFGNGWRASPARQPR